MKTISRHTVGLALLVSLFLSFTGCTTPQAQMPGPATPQQDTPVRPKNMILFIGDGMGVSHVTAGKVVKGTLNLERFKVMGLQTTYSEDSFVTDSAASGTALATGHKTYNGAISVSRDQTPLKTVIEYAEEKGKATGLAVACSVTHATPAVFVAHVKKRKMQSEIAEQLPGSGIDVLFGGGLGYFVPASVDDSLRKDEKNPLAQLEGRMKVVRTAAEFQALGSVDAAAGLFAKDHPPRADTREPRLSELAAKAIEILSRDPDGFFLMVEGSQIDWGGHANDQDYIITEMIDFDDAVGVGLEFAEKDGNTLIVVTADHETGGFGIRGGSIKDKTVTSSGFIGKGHTATMVPLFAYGPGSYAFAGIQDNTVIGRTLIEYVQ